MMTYNPPVKEIDELVLQMKPDDFQSPVWLPLGFLFRKKKE